MSVLASLRSETNRLHACLHALPAFRDLVKQQLPMSGYCALLGRLYGFYEPLDFRFADGVAMLGDLHPLTAYVPRAPLLSKDLAALGLNARVQNELPRCHRLPRLRSKNQVLGGLYVIEGSVLGGRVLCARLDSLFGPTATKGRGYFRWCACQDRKRWMQLCAAIEARHRHAGAADELIATAKQLFAAMLGWMREGEGTVQGRTCVLGAA